jgi:phosphatidylserine decarboxylase
VAEKVINTVKGHSGPIARPGYLFIGGGLVVLILGIWAGGWFLPALGLVMTGFFAYFFRDPERVIPTELKAIVSPADGRVIVRETVREEQFLNQPTNKLSIFMNLFDVHVNRAPVSGRLKALAYRPGRYIPANRLESSQVNEQQALLLETESGKNVVMVQIAGVLARRIITDVEEGDRVDKGERVGMICFGSRVDLYLPEDCTVSARVGDRVKAGSSIVGRFS